jgi:hypothetical protein
VLSILFPLHLLKGSSPHLAQKLRFPVTTQGLPFPGLSAYLPQSLTICVRAFSPFSHSKVSPDSCLCSNHLSSLFPFRSSKHKLGLKRTKPPNPQPAARASSQSLSSCPTKNPPPSRPPVSLGTILTPEVRTVFSSRWALSF